MEKSRTHQNAPLRNHCVKIFAIRKVLNISWKLVRSKYFAILDSAQDYYVAVIVHRFLFREQRTVRREESDKSSASKSARS